MTLHATDSMAQQAITCNGTAHHTTPRHNHTIIGTDVIIIGLILYLRIMNKTYHIAIVAQPLHAMQGPAIACHSAVLHSISSHAKNRHNKTLLHSTPIHARTCYCTPFRSTTQRNHSNKSTDFEPTTSDLTTSEPTYYSEDSIRADHHRAVNCHDKPHHNRSTARHAKPWQSAPHYDNARPCHCIMRQATIRHAIACHVMLLQSTVSHAISSHGRAQTCSVRCQSLPQHVPSHDRAHHALPRHIYAIARCAKPSHVTILWGEPHHTKPR